jgi:hypothetical protein
VISDYAHVLAGYPDRYSFEKSGQIVQFNAAKNHLRPAAQFGEFNSRRRFLELENYFPEISGRFGYVILRVYSIYLP